MTYDLLQFGLYFLALFVLCPPMGWYMADVYEGKRTWLTPIFAPVEKVLYKIVGTKPEEEQNFARYTLSLLGFNIIGLVILYAMMRLQDHLPLNPAGEAAVAPHLAFNTAVSFITNTNWQSYGGESTMSYFTQMAGLTFQNFVSAATGMAVAVAVARGFVRKQTDKIGNFWVDMVRGTFYILLPFSIVAALFFVWQGMPQNMHPYVVATTMEGAQQTIAQGPVAGQEAIKMLGTNGGGFFNVNSAHPYENPNPLTNFIELFFILWIGGAFCFTYGKLTGDPRQGRAIFAAMTIMLVAALAVCYLAEKQGNPFIAADVIQTDGNMEGKEVRFGVATSTLWATTTAAASNGSVNSMHDSYTPIGGMMPLFELMTGEVVFGGVGSGFYGMLMYIVLAVFIAGLMVGRTPEYLGKKIEAREITLAVFGMLATPIGILVLGCFSAVLPQGLTSMANKGPHGLSEVIYAYASGVGNNGSAFAGFNANTPFQDTMMGIAMLLGRYTFIITLLGIAGSMALKKAVPPSPGTFPTHVPLFVGLLIGVIVIVGVLNFFPVLALGPIAEHLAMVNGTTF